MNNSIIYARFSDRPDAKTSESCVYQREICEKYCKANELEVVGFYEDRAVSGKTPIEDRPGLSAAMESMQADYTLVVYNYDRLARDRIVHVAIESYVIGIGAHILSVMQKSTTKDETPEDELIRSIMQGLSSYQRKANAKRTSDAMLSHQKRGRIMSHRLPYGQKIDPADPKLMVPCEVEQEGLKLILELDASGEGTRAIARMLIDKGFKPRGEKWHATTIQRIINRETQDQG